MRLTYKENKVNEYNTCCTQNVKMSIVFWECSRVNFLFAIQSTLVISTSFISNNCVSRRESVVLV